MDGLMTMLHWMRTDYRRHRHTSRKTSPDLSRFYTRKAVKYYRQYVLRKSRFLRMFNWLIEPMIRKSVSRSANAYMQKGASYR